MENTCYLPETKVPRIVIVGGGFGGLQLAKSLKKKPFQVVLVDKNNYHTFQPLLYQVATAGLGVDSIAAPFRDIFKGQKNFFFRMGEVIEVCPEQNYVRTSMDLLHYDYLVIACGASPNFFENKDLEETGLTMKSVQQALDIRTRLLANCELALRQTTQNDKLSYLNVVIAGGGPTGVELAGAIAELRDKVLVNDYPELPIKDMKILLIHGADRLLPTMDEASGKKSFTFLKRLGVEIILGKLVSKISENGVVLKDGDILTSKTLLWTAGVKGICLPGIMDECIENGNRYLVDEFNTVVGYSNIFAIGDVAKMITKEYPKGHPGLAPVAIQQGKLLANNLESIQNGLPLKPFKYKNKGVMATVGRNKAVVEMPNGWKSQGTLAWFMWMAVHLLLLVGFKNKAITLLNWTIAYLNYNRTSRLITRPFTKSLEKFAEEEKLALKENPI